MQGAESFLSSAEYSPDSLRALSPKVREDIANSEVVTLDVGWNDWWSMIVEGGFVRSNIQYILLLKDEQLVDQVAVIYIDVTQLNDQGKPEGIFNVFYNVI